MSTPKLYRVILPVSDIEVAIRFYGLVLGTKGERVSPGRHYFNCGNVIFACYDPVADGDSLGEGWTYHEHQYLYFAVPDLNDVLSRIEEAGGLNLTEIEEMPWGERMFYALDPLGSRISFVDKSTVFTGSR